MSGEGGGRGVVDILVREGYGAFSWVDEFVAGADSLVGI